MEGCWESLFSEMCMHNYCIYDRHSNQAEAQYDSNSYSVHHTAPLEAQILLSIIWRGPFILGIRRHHHQPPWSLFSVIVPTILTLTPG